MTGPKPSRRARADTTRLKREVAANDSMYRGLRSAAITASPASAVVLDSAAKTAFNSASAKQDTLDALRRAAPTGTHHSFAENVDAFDGTAITSESAPKPPAASIPRGNPTPDVLPRAVGSPAQRGNLVDAKRTASHTLEAGNTRPESSTGRGPSAPQNFDGASV